MENSKRPVNESAEIEVLPIKTFSESDLQSKWRSINPNADNENDLRVIGFKVQVDDDQVYSFTLDKARSKSADILSILSGSDEVYSQEITHTRRSSSEEGRFSTKIPCVIPQTAILEQALNSESIDNGKELGTKLLLQSTGPPTRKAPQDENEATKTFSSVPNACITNQGEISKNKESKEGLETIPALELKLSSTCIDKNDLEIHIKSKYDNLFSSSVNERQCLNNGYYEKDHSAYAEKINVSSKYDNLFSPSVNEQQCLYKGYYEKDHPVDVAKINSKYDHLFSSSVDEIQYLNKVYYEKDHPVHVIKIKSKYDNLFSSSVNDQQCLNKGCYEKDHPVDVAKINHGTDKSHYGMYMNESPAMPLEHLTEMPSRKSQTENEIIADSNQKANLEVVSHSILKNIYQTENARPFVSQDEMMELTESKKKHIFTNEATTQTKKVTNSSYSPTETTAIISMKTECDASTQTKETENVEPLPDFSTYLVDRENVAEKLLPVENLPIIPVMEAKAEKVKAEENQIEEHCQCSCGHKKQHDCIYRCCYHRDSANIIPTSILFGQSLQYFTSMYETLKCDYCRCRLNRSCSEITDNCAEKLISDIHPQYCCKCGMSAKSVKDASTSMSQTEKQKNPKSIELKSELLRSVASKEKVVHQQQIKINKSLEPLKGNEQNNIATKVSSSPEIEKTRFVDTPLVIERCLDAYQLKKIEKSRLEVNPVDIKLDKKTLSEKQHEEQLKSNVQSSKSKNEKREKKGSNQSIFSATEKNSIRSKSKLDSYYSHSSLCPCRVCHSNAEDLPEKENNLLLLNCCGTYLKLKNGSSDKQFRSTSPKIKAENFDYIAKDGWKPHNYKSDEFLTKKIDVNDDIRFGKASEEECFESVTEGLADACQIVNDYLLSSHPVEENYYSKQQVQKSAAILHKRWFAVVGSKYCDVLEVRNFIRYFKEFSNNLLKALLHSVDNNGNNVLHFAFANNKFDLVDELLKSGFALELLNKGNKSGNTPLMICGISQPKDSKDWSIVRRCFEFSDVNQQSAKNGQTPLMNAASCGFQIMLDLLLDVGANPNLQDKDGSTALMYAAEHGHEKCVKSLMKQKKCDSTIRDKDGETACSIALSNGYKNIAVLIHMKALQKVIISQNSYSSKRFIWTNINKTARMKTSVPCSTSNFDISRENH